MRDSLEKFDEAISCLSPGLKARLAILPESLKRTAHEIRIRLGVPIILVCENAGVFVGDNGRISYMSASGLPKVSENDIKESLNTICGYSLHSCQDSLNEGYVTVKGGHRVGIAARAVTECGKVRGIKDVSFLNVRIARQVFEVADDIYRKFFSYDPQNLIISGPPSSGKTTVLRDLARKLSDFGGNNSYRTCIIDERDEIAATFGGQAQNDVGENSCVLSGFPKSQGIIHAIRSLSPQIILFDEIGENDEIASIKQGLSSGVNFVFTVHAGTAAELSRREQIRRLYETGAFEHIVLLKLKPFGDKEIYKIGDILG